MGGQRHNIPSGHYTKVITLNIDARTQFIWIENSLYYLYSWTKIKHLPSSSWCDCQMLSG